MVILVQSILRGTAPPLPEEPVREFYRKSYRSIRKLGVPYFVVLIIRILLFRVLY